MHWNVEGNQRGVASGLFGERLSGKIVAGNLVPALPKPRSRRSQAERLAPQFIRGQKQNLHQG
jgi:hypothetical protein